MRRKWKQSKSYIILRTRIGISMVLSEIIDKIQHNTGPPIYSLPFLNGIYRRGECSPEKLLNNLSRRWWGAGCVIIIICLHIPPQSTVNSRLMLLTGVSCTAWFQSELKHHVQRLSPCCLILPPSCSLHAAFVVHLSISLLLCDDGGDDDGGGDDGGGDAASDDGS